MTDNFDLLRAAEWLEVERPRFLRELETLVNIDSGTFDKVGVDAVGALLRERYQSLGATIDVMADEFYGDTFVARLEGQGTARILLLGHMDTVYPTGTVQERPFRIDDGRGYGPGAADMKSGDLAIVYAIEALQAQGFDDFRSITVLHNSDEEVGSPSSRDAIRRESEVADVVYVLEAGRENGDIVSARKGIADFKLHVTGRSAHAGVNRERGCSAALELSHLVVALEGINGQVPGASLNVGRVEAGHRPNVVPDQGFAHFEARAFDAPALEEVIRRVQSVVEKRTVNGTSAEVAVSVEHYPMHKSETTARLVRLAQELGQTLGLRLKDTSTGGASDGNTAASAGRPVLDGLGPVGGSAHSPGEYVLISSIAPRTALLAGLIAGGPSALQVANFM
jgi:glutamate carboxypeptidase